MLNAVSRDEARLSKLPGIDRYPSSGTETTDAERLTVGFPLFPAGAAAEGLVHPDREGAFCSVAAHGELMTPERPVPLEPGTTVFIPIVLHHQTVSHGPRRSGDGDRLRSRGGAGLTRGGQVTNRQGGRP